MSASHEKTAFSNFYQLEYFSNEFLRSTTYRKYQLTLYYATQSDISMYTHQAHWRIFFAKYVILAIFSAIFDFLSRGTFLLKHICLSIYRGDLIFMFWRAIHMCYEIINPESWCDYHDIWVGFSHNIHRNRFLVFKISKNRSAEISVIITYDFTRGSRIYPFSFGIIHVSIIHS